MIKVLIFGGTTEGRELASWCIWQQIPAMISVASNYGSHVLPQGEHLRIQEGRLNQIQMKQLLEQQQPELVLDATHPYADVVTDIIQEVCETLKVPYQRVLRSSSEWEPGQRIITVADIHEAAAFLSTTTGNIFLTTGSKDLKTFLQIPDSHARIYARVLPDSQVMAMCESYGIRGSHLIGMQGPFAVEMNQAMLEQTKADWLVTKESGANGGFHEKMEAAMRAGVSVLVIGRPKEEAGISLEQAKAMIKPEPKRRIVMIGMGMGGGSQLTLEALEAIKASQVVFGAKRMLEDIVAWTTGKTIVTEYLGEAIVRWIKENPGADTIAVIYSGDTGFYSGSSSLIQRLQQEDALMKQVELTVYPGISTVACLCARLKTSWEDVKLASSHGREADIISLLHRHSRVFLLLGGEQPFQQLCQVLLEHGCEQVRISAGERLGYADERILCGTPSEMIDTTVSSLVAVLIERKESR